MKLRKLIVRPLPLFAFLLTFFALVNLDREERIPSNHLTSTSLSLFSVEEQKEIEGLLDTLWRGYGVFYSLFIYNKGELSKAYKAFETSYILSPLKDFRHLTLIAIEHDASSNFDEISYLTKSYSEYRNGITAKYDRGCKTPDLAKTLKESFLFKIEFLKSEKKITSDLLKALPATLFAIVFFLIIGIFGAPFFKRLSRSFLSKGKTIP